MEDKMLPRPAWISIGRFRNILLLSLPSLLVLLEAHAQPLPDGHESGSGEIEAGMLMADALQTVRAGIEAEKTSYAASYKLYREALDDLEFIVDEYRASKTASRLLQGKSNVGPWKLSGFREAVDGIAKLRAEAESDPLVCALLAAASVENPAHKAGLLSEIASKAIEAGNLELSLEVLVQTTQSASALEDDWAYQQSLLVRTAAGYAKIGEESRALAMAEEIVDPEFRADALARISVEQERAGRSGEASVTLLRSILLAKSQESEFTRIRTLTDVVQMLMQAGQHGQAFMVAYEVEDEYIKDLMLEEMAVDLAEAGDLAEAQQAAQAIKHPMSRAVALTFLASRYAGSGSGERAAGLLGQALSAARLIRDDGDRLSLMAEVAGSFGSMGYGGKASAILAEMHGLAQVTKDPDRKVNILIAAAGGYIRAGNKEKASKMLSSAAAIAEKLVKDDFRGMAFSKIAIQFVRLGQYDHAIEIAANIDDEMVMESVRIQMTYELIRGGAFDRAYALISEIKDISSKNLALSDMAVTMAAAGSCEEGYAAAGSIDGSMDRLSAFVCIAEMFARKGEDYSATELLRGAFGEALAMPESAEKAHLLARIAAGYLEARQLDEFMDATRAMTPFEKAWVMTEISDWYRAEKEGGQAGASMNFLHEIIQSI